MKQIVVGFSKENFTKEEIQKMTNRQRYEAYLECSDSTFAYGTVQDFINDLNDEVIDGYVWALVDVE